MVRHFGQYVLCMRPARLNSYPHSKHRMCCRGGSVVRLIVDAPGSAGAGGFCAGGLGPCGPDGPGKVSRGGTAPDSVFLGVDP
ncbi:MAG: hypothetical protein BWY59_00212 [Verrucomicrobia bacterium ADurb.Bin345]|nr:MAG: hypothetical protein BWY59_00212 [Verrucomicrobia bacterium ADurb.Bin345]